MRSSYQDIFAPQPPQQPPQQSPQQHPQQHPQQQRERERDHSTATPRQQIVPQQVYLRETSAEKRHTERSTPKDRDSSAEEVAKLRALLSAATSELSRQISAVGQKVATSGSNEPYELMLLQKQVVLMESKMHLSQTELVDNKTKAEEAAGKVAALETRNSEIDNRYKSLQSEHARILSGQDSEKNGSNGNHADHGRDSLNGINQSVELIKKTRECEAVRTQHEELLHRHTVLQRSLQLLDQQKGTDSKMLSDVSLRLSDSEEQVNSLESRHNLVKEENEILKEQLRAELEKIEERRIQGDAEHQESIARAHTVILAQRAEIDAALHTEGSLVQELADLVKSTAHFKTQHEEMSNKEQWLLSRLFTHDQRESQTSVILDNTSARAYAKLLTKPVFTEWKDLMCNARARRWTLHSLFSGISGGWHRRFRKNHFLAWKFYTKTLISECASKIATIHSQALVDAFSSWAALPHLSVQQQREAELRNELEAAKAEASLHMNDAAMHIRKVNLEAEAKVMATKDSATAEAIERQAEWTASEEKLKQAIEALDISQKSLYQTELDNKVTREAMEKENERAIASKIAEIALLQIEKSKIEETLKKTQVASVQNVEKVLKKAEEEKVALNVAVATAEKGLKEVTLKGQRLEEDFQAKLNSSYSDAQFTDEINRLKRILMDEHEATMKLSGAEEEAKNRINKTKHEAEVATLKDQVRKEIAKAMQHEQNTTQVEKQVGELEMRLRTATDNITALKEEIGILNNQVNSLKRDTLALVADKGMVTASAEERKMALAKLQDKLQVLLSFT